MVVCQASILNCLSPLQCWNPNIFISYFRLLIKFQKVLHQFSGTLFNYLDNCVTSSGKRLLRKWICHPLKCVEGINNRLNVVEDLMKQSEIMSIITQHLRKLPDIERMLGRVKASFQASASLVLPFIGKKVLKQRVSYLLSHQVFSCSLFSEECQMLLLL